MKFYFHCDARVNRFYGDYQYGCSRMVTVVTQHDYLDSTHGEYHYCWQHKPKA